MKGQSNTKPNQQVKSGGKTQVNYNTIQKEITDDHGTRTVWEYDLVEIDGIVTKAKIKEHMQNAEHEKDTSFIVVDDINSELLDSKTELLISNITNKTYSEIDTYIDNNVYDMTTAKNYLKKLSKVVLAMLKRINV